VVQIILWYLDSGCSKLDLEEWLAPVRISSGPEPIMMTPTQAMQDKIHEFDQLKVWELVPRPPSRRRE
ncbi:hypothetical protein Tco_0245160, partial [Tanacetum coccineum]